MNTENNNLLLACLMILLAAPGFLYLSYEETNAKLEQMSPQDMRDVSGQSLIDFRSESGSVIDYTFTTTTQTSCGWYSCNTNTFTNTTTYRDQTDITFDRIEVDGELRFEGGISSARVGYYDDSGDFGSSLYSASGSTQSDLVIDNLDITNSGSGTSASLVNPYVELAFENHGDGSNRELKGLRIGTEEVNGNLTFQLDQLSGTVHAACTGIASVACGNIVENEHRTSNSLVDLANTFGFDAVLQFNDTQDFWVSVNKEDIVWEHQNPILPGTPGDNNGMDLGSREFHTDGKGFWLHLTDDVTGGI
jgi:hypothetical protein